MEPPPEPSPCWAAWTMSYSGKYSNKYSNSTSRAKCLETIFFEAEWHGKRFQMKLVCAAIDSVKFSSKSELSSQFFGRLKLSMAFEYLSLKIAELWTTLLCWTTWTVNYEKYREPKWIQYSLKKCLTSFQYVIGLQKMRDHHPQKGSWFFKLNNLLGWHNAIQKYRNDSNRLTCVSATFGSDQILHAKYWTWNHPKQARQEQLANQGCPHPLPSRCFFQPGSQTLNTPTSLETRVPTLMSSPRWLATPSRVSQFWLALWIFWTFYMFDDE